MTLWQSYLAITCSIIVILGGIVKIYQLTKRIDASIGLDREGRTVSERIGRVEHQLWPNGGSSLMDKVNANERVNNEISGEITIIRELLQALLTNRQ